MIIIKKGSNYLLKMYQNRYFERAWLQVNTSSRRPRVKVPEPVANVDLTPESTIEPMQGLGSFRSGSLPNVAAPQATYPDPETTKVPILRNQLEICRTCYFFYFKSYQWRAYF